MSTSRIQMISKGRRVAFFNAQSHFAKVFCQFMGVTPKHYKAGA